ncbi:carboxylesterase/lipase family protein [Actinocorallia sp. A-T 12471]|uniref:carboxylesterase/lipase family protein n=1 Tax=Actinocorallia sp. A-T 12471 TaxID=3089813 RepID=UPI0029D18D1F|nr:carboxylesterase family protein [Actinocorallia sp. A-T 12471]MDX6738761.1 carboxylesterase family protein [Actinocorallia sp. A-T 12471]
MDVEVKTALGKVRGVRTEGCCEFLGIPYAEPPVGELRYAAPKRAAPWEGVLDGTRFSPSPPQMPDVSVPPPPEGVPAQEYLTVNVWTPDPGATRLPVLVWIYGGGFIAGTSADPSFDCARLARDGGGVTVSMNYRVGVEGFARLEGAVGNRALLDIVCALEWVHENISAFGGDPGQITLWGQSAGAGTTMAVAVMPAAEGLFHRIIAGSVPNTCFAPDLAERVTGEIAREAGRAPTAADFSRADPDDLVRALDAVAKRASQYAERWGPAFYGPVLGPVVDGEDLPVDPWTALAGGALGRVPLLLGHTRDEFRLFLARQGELGEITEKQTKELIHALAPGTAAAYERNSPGATTEEIYGEVYSDWLFRMPTYTLARLHAGETHLYELDFTVPVHHGALGAPHCSDLPLVFGVFDRGLGTELYADSPSPEAIALGDAMRQRWIDFVRWGDPGWEPFTGEDGPTRLLAIGSRTAPYPRAGSAGIWADHVWGPAT